MATKKHDFSIGEAISFGWKQATSRILFFVVLFLIVIVIASIPGIITSIFGLKEDNFLTFALQLVGIALQLTISLGLLYIGLRLYNKKRVAYSDLFKKFNLIIPYFISSIAYILIIIVGFILLVIPAFVWSIKYRYFAYIMVDQGLGPIDAIRESGKITEGVKWKIFWFSIVLALINLLGMLALVVGLFITVPLSLMAEIYVYRKLAGK